MKSKIIPYILTCVLIAAHFMRASNGFMVIVSTLFPLMLFIKKPWVPMISQIFAYLGAGLWLGTTLDIAKERLMMGDDWIRMAAILGVVALFSAWSGILLNHDKVTEHYK